MSMLKPVVLRVVLMAFGLGVGSGAPAEAPSEPVLKAGFVYNFGKFTEWPPGSPPGAPMWLCLIGNDPQGALTATVEGRLLQGRPVRVRRNPRTEELRTCQIVYVTDPDERHQAEVLRALREQPVLTVGDVDGFIDLGGMIGLGMASGKVRFDINQEAVQAGGLKLSSQLMRLARTVKGQGS
jgi:hypothetical protein